MLDRHVQNHLGRQLRALLGGACMDRSQQLNGPRPQGDRIGQDRGARPLDAAPPPAASSKA